MSKKLLSKCIICGKEFLYYKCAQPNRKYCGRECFKKDISNIQNKETSVFYVNRLKNGISMFGIKKCLECGKDFEKMSPKQKYCGSKKKKTGCSFKISQINIAIRNKKYKPAKYQHTNCHKCNAELQKGNTLRRLCDYCRDIRKRVYTSKIREKKEKIVKVRRLKLRFIIFQRDNFTCQYCGRKSPNVVLQIDHIYPKSKGGLDKKENYKTACSECNLGKGDKILNEFKVSNVKKYGA